MRHSFLKLMGLALALMLTLTGCNLIGVDPIMQLDEDTAKLKKDYEAVVAEYDGGTLTKGDVMGAFASNYTYYSQMYSMFGMSMNADVMEDVKQQTLEQEIQAIAVHNEMEKRGLSIDAEKQAEIDKTAADNYKQAYDSYYAQTTGKDEKLREAQTLFNMLQNGYTEDTFKHSQLEATEHEMVEEDVKAEIKELTDEELKAAYDEKVTADESAYSGNAGSFETAMSSEDDVVTWMPEGYRTVKHILVKPEDDVLKAVTDARTALDTAQESLEKYQTELEDLNDADPDQTESEDASGETEEEASTEEAEETPEPTEEPRSAEEIQSDIDAAQAEVDTAKKAVEEAEAACLESVKEKTDEIYKKLADGAEFADLIAEYGEDPGMQNEPTATRGYYVSANSENWDKNFTAGAMSLEKVGDVTETPVISTSGVHIIRYESDVTPGAVPLEDIHDALYDSTLETRKQDHYDEALKSWTEALNPVYHLDAFTIG